jgi:hypothetical protein
MNEGSDEYKSEELTDPLDADGNMAGCNSVYSSDLQLSDGMKRVGT